MGVLTSRNPDTPEGLESRLSNRICRIPAELPHSIEQELGKLHPTRTDSGKVLSAKTHRRVSTGNTRAKRPEPLSVSPAARTRPEVEVRWVCHLTYT
jgi:hypothetical protein